MNEIKDVENILKELGDLLEKSSDLDQDPLIIEAKKTIVDISRGCKIDLHGNLTDDDISTLWNEYKKRSNPQCLGIEETVESVAKETKYVIFIVGLYAILGGQNSMGFLEHVLALTKIIFGTAIALKVLDIFDKKTTKTKKKKGYK